jgi:hypothetical protein
MQKVTNTLLVAAMVVLAATSASAQDMGINELNQAYFRFTAGGLSVHKVAESNGDFTLRLRTAEEQAVITLQQERLLDVSVNGRELKINLESVRDNPRKLADIRVLLAASSAIEQFRALAGSVEGKALEDPNLDLSVAEETLLLDGAFVASLSGDTAAVKRQVMRLMRRQRLIRVRQTRDCLGEYVAFVGWAFNEYLRCQEEAMRTGWPYYPALIFACTTMYYGRTQSAWWQMIACSAVPVK